MSAPEADPLASGPRNPASLVDYADGAVVSRTLRKSPAGTLTVFAFDRGQGLSEHTTPHEAAVLVLDGAADWTVGGEPVRVGAGEMIGLPAGVPHAVHAAERFKMLLIMLRS
jgi:quercetin dioxygenase-like cupin family protein